MIARYNETAVPRDAVRYTKANSFLMELKKHIRDMDSQQYKAIREQALEGDVVGADERMRRVLGITSINTVRRMKVRRRIKFD